MIPIGMHIAFDTAQPGSDYSTITIVASNGKGDHAITGFEYVVSDNRQQTELVGLAIEEFGRRLKDNQLAWMPDPDKESVDIPEHIKLDGQEQEA